MSKQARPNWSQAKPRSNDFKEIWAAGYPLTLMTDFSPDIDKSEDNLGVYGYEATIDTQVLNAGTLSMKGIFDTTMQVLYDVASGVDPRTSGIKGNYPVNAFLDFARLTKDVTRKYYEVVEIFPKVSFAITPPTGGPKEKGQFTMNGRSGLSLMLVAAPGKGLAISWDVIALTAGEGTLTGDMDSQPTLIPAAIPGYPNAGKFAMTLEVQKRTTSTGTCIIKDYALLPVTNSNVTSGTTKGKITISANDLLGTNIQMTDTNLYAFVSYIKEVTPDGSTSYLLGDMVDCRGRFDWPGALT